MDVFLFSIDVDSEYWEGLPAWVMFLIVEDEVAGSRPLSA